MTTIAAAGIGVGVVVAGQPRSVFGLDEAFGRPQGGKRWGPPPMVVFVDAEAIARGTYVTPWERPQVVMPTSEIGRAESVGGFLHGVTGRTLG
jgi:hypothetical protein